MKFHFGSNLKMNLVPAETSHFVSELATWLAEHPAPSRPLQLWIAPSHTNLLVAAQARGTATLWIGAQNVHWLEAGAPTGEISAAQVKACGADFVLLGHAERRVQFGETDAQISLKAQACERHALRIILCVGETRSAYHEGIGTRYVSSQLERATAELHHPDRLLVLYEPVWAIGTDGRAADPKYVGHALESIRETLARRYGGDGEAIPVLYGGSVDAANTATYAGLNGCDGLGVGRAAWRAPDFIRVLEAALSVQRLAA